MSQQKANTLLLGFSKAALLVAVLGSPAQPQDSTTGQPVAEVQQRCAVDLTRAGMMSDIVSNALRRGLGQPESEIRAFLDGAETRYSTGAELLTAAALKFNVGEAALTAAVERFRHCNCGHGEVGDDLVTPLELSKFAGDVTVHVVLHELGHALIREFDLPVLGNEETAADAFATHYITTYLPERAVDVIGARTRSLMIEAAELPRERWPVSGEHNSDARRAFQIAAVAVAADPETFREVAMATGMTDREIEQASDYGTEIHRSWRRLLQPLWMPAGLDSKETRAQYDSASSLIQQVRASGLGEELMLAFKRFDWHSQVTLSFKAGQGSAGWSRSKRTVSVHSEYLERFVRQGLSTRESRE